MKLKYKGIGLKLRTFEWNSKKAPASDNTIFTHRAIRLSVRQKLEADSGMRLAVAEKGNQPDTPAPPNRIAAGHYVTLRWWGVVNTRTLYEIRLNQILRSATNGFYF
jgi:hypothetical protein